MTPGFVMLGIGLSVVLALLVYGCVNFARRMKQAAPTGLEESHPVDPAPRIEPSEE